MSSRRLHRIGQLSAGVYGAAMIAASACGVPLVTQPEQPCCATQPAVTSVWSVSFGHSESDRAEEPGHLDAFEQVMLPRAMAEGATVIVFTVGADGLTSPRVLARVSFDTADVDGGNPELRRQLMEQRRAGLIADVRAGLRDTPYSPASDPFGGFAAASEFLAQFPTANKTLLAFGDQLANRPIGCVLGERDLTPPRRQALLAICSPTTPMLADVHVLLAGAAYSTDEPIMTSTAVGVEGLLREHFGNAGATVELYGPVALTPGEPPR